jgi:hypothetical protein
MSLNELETDEHGNVVAKALTGWTITTIKDITAIVQIEYADSEHATKPDRKIIQLEFTPQQCLQLASSLVGVADHILQQKLIQQRLGTGGGSGGKE